jgi:hypothetical protein
MKGFGIFYGFLLFLFVNCDLAFSQSGVVVSGSSSTSSSGSFSYSVGQLSYLKGTGDGGSVLHGNQQSVEIFEGESIGLSDVQIEFSVFPNPVEEELRIDFSGSIPKNTVVRITNVEGKIVMEQPIEQQNTILNLSNFPKGSYILLLTDTEGEWMKSYKLLKTL